MHSDIQEILLTEAELQAKVKELGRQITKDFQGKNLVLICVLKGAVTFLSDLMRTIDLPLSIDFMSVSSYGDGTVSSGNVKIIKDLDRDITGKDVLVVEDIIDSGTTLSYLLDLFRQRSAASVSLCTILNKPDRRKRDVKIDYCGFSIPDAFVVGYGLDYAENYRNLPYVGILKSEIYNK